MTLAYKTNEWGLYDIVLYHLCLAYIKTGNYAAAHENILLLVKYRELYCEKGAIEIGEAYHGLGMAQYYLGYFEEALESYCVALEYYETLEEESDNVRLSNLYGDIGGIYLDLGQFGNALTFLQNDINMKEQMKIPDVELAIAYNNIADLYMQTERYDLAEQNLLRAIELISRQWGQQSYHLESVYNNLANLYHNLGQGEKALHYICRSIDIQSAEFEKHPLLSISYNSKALILQSLGRIEEALQENDKARIMLLDTLNEENMTMGFVELMYASAYSDIQNYSEVIPHAKKACKILIKFYTNDNIHLINARILLGEALSYTGDYQSALNILRQVEKRTESDLLLAQNFRSVLNLIRIYTELSQHEDALQQCIKALKLCKQIDQAQELSSLIFEKLLLCYKLSGRKEDELDQWLQKTFKEYDSMKANYQPKSPQSHSSKPIQMDSPMFVSIDADPLKLAYVMLTSGLYYNCELSWFNPNPKHYDDIHVFPRDVYFGRTITDKNVGTFPDLCWTKDELEVDAFLCVCALNKEDSERINLGHYGSEGQQESTISIFLEQGRSGAKQRVNTIVKDLKSKYKEIFP